jgi:hypothetical protein
VNAYELQRECNSIKSTAAPLTKKGVVDVDAMLRDPIDIAFDENGI